jgi:putative ABC transport system permease protein
MPSLPFFDRVRFAWRALFHREHVSREFDREMHFHVDMEAQLLEQQGHSPAEARRRAQIAFGGRQRFREEAREAAHGRVLDDLLKDLQHAARTFRRTPGFTLTVIATLAIGIGATTVIFSVTDNVVLRTLPGTRTERMASVEVFTDMNPNLGPTMAPNAAHYLAWRAGCTLCEELALLHPQTVTLYGVGDPTVLPTMKVSDNAFATLGARAQLGRLIMPGDDAPGNNRVVVISDALWRQQFGARRDIVGRTIELGVIGNRFTVIGVTTPEFPKTYGNVLASFTTHPQRAELFLPMALLPYQRTTGGEHDYGVLAVMRQGVTREALRSQLDAISAANMQIFREKTPERASVVSLRDTVVRGVERPLLLLLGAVAAVLLIMCVNLANLFLARSATRRRESAVRIALGASRSRLIRQALTETICLSLVGGGLGVVASRFGVRLLVALAPPNLPRINEVHVDVRVTVVAVLLSIVVGVAFGILPARRLSRTNAGDVLKDGGRSASGGRSSARIRDLLIASQIGLSALLLVIGGLFLESFVRVIHADRGFTAERVLAIDVPLTPREYPDAASRTAFYDEAARRLSALPGVVGTGLTNFVPLEGEAWGESIFTLSPDGIRSPEIVANFRFVSANYFSLMGIQILSGRAFSEADRGTARMLISDNLARALWPGESPLGKRAPLGGTDSLYEIIGVTSNVRTSGIEHDASPTVFRPSWEFGRAENFVIRTTNDPTTLTIQARRIIHELSPTAPIAKVRTMDQIVSAVVAQRRFELVLIELFAATALIVACVGIYGMIAHSLSSRTNEISIRLALGALAVDVHKLVLREMTRPVMFGLVAGIGASVLISRAVAGLLFEVRPTSALTLASVAALLMLVAAVACWIPSRRATKLDPVEALRAG